MDNTIKQVIEEMGANNVADIVYNEQKEKWVVTYKQHSLNPDEFNTLFDALQFFIEEELSNL